MGGKCSASQVRFPIQHRVHYCKHLVIYKHKGSFYCTHWVSLTSVCYAVYQDTIPDLPLYGFMLLNKQMAAELFFKISKCLCYFSNHN